MKKFTFAILSPAVLAGVSVLAQAPPPAPPEPPNMGGPGVFLIRGPEMGFHQSLKPVLNAPYQAEAQTTTTQHLADGNVIERSHTSKMARDKQGRTWTEETLDRMGPWSSQDSGPGPRNLVFIFDPVAGYSYTLHPDDKTAERRSMPQGPPTGKRLQLDKRMAEDMFYTSGSAQGAVTMDYRPAPPDQAGAKPDVKVEKLGSQQVNGVAAQGKRTTHTVPANAIGNQLPIVTVNESWFSPDLQMVVESKRTDPRFGDTTFELKNIQKGDPPASLFSVPSDYTVKEAGHFAGHMQRP